MEQGFLDRWLVMTRRTRSMQIAILDDNVDVGDMIKEGLQLAGHTVSLYLSPSKFLTDLRDPTKGLRSLDLLIVDFDLAEGISGVEVIIQVRIIFPNLPVIFITAASTREIDAARRAIPGLEVLRKPFRMSALLTMVKNL
jgi:DNA-binding response OmpR family regulator